MTYRFALRWTVIGLVCALAILALAIVVKVSQPVVAPATLAITFDDLAAAAEMPLNANGIGTQVISGTTLTLKIQPYPPQASAPTTLTLVAISPAGTNSLTVTPTLRLTGDDQPAAKEFTPIAQPDHSYVLHGILFPRPGQWHASLEVYVGDEIPATMLFSVNAK